MPNTFQGDASLGGGRFAIAVSRYNETVTSRLLEGAVATLLEAGVDDGNIDVAYVPGAYELPLIAHKLAGSGQYEAVICLGAVIRGETTHDQHINRAVSVGLTQVALESEIPVAFGVLTCESLEQALNRAGGSVGNKGVEAARSALEMADLLRNLSHATRTPSSA